MNQILITILFTFLSFPTNQSHIDLTITSKVIDKATGQPLEYETVAFFSKAENRIVTGGITDMTGNFSIPVPSGTYDVSVEFISFKKQIIPDQSLTTSKNIGNFY